MKKKEVKLNNYGYACINMELAYPPKGVQRVTTGRSMIKRTYLAKGNSYASEITLKNAMDLDKIIDWNILNGYNFFRITSTLAPWKSLYDWTDLPEIDKIKQYLHSAGTKATTHGLRLTTHPGPFNVLTSPHKHVVENCVADLTYHGDMLDMMKLSRTPYNKINIHIGGAYGDKPGSLERFCKNFELLPESVQSRLTVENDDKASMFSTKFLYENIYKVSGTPIVFDSHHFSLGPQDASYNESFDMAFDSWPSTITPSCHHSNGKKEFEDLLKQDFKTRDLREHTIVKAKVGEIGKKFVIIDINGKSDGVIPIEEFKLTKELDSLKENSEIEVYLERLEGPNGIVVSREKAKRLASWKRMEKCFNDQEEVEGVITNRCKGGMIVNIDSCLCFLPGSQIDAKPLKNFDHLMNTPLKFLCVKLDDVRGNIVVSRRAVLEKSRNESLDKLLTKFKEGSIVEGQVKAILDWGAFLDLNGVDLSLIHI